MTSLIEQTEILSEICQILYDSAPNECDRISCIFTYDYGYDDGSYSVGEAFEYDLRGQTVYSLTNDPDRKATELIVKLHNLMKAHTGGEWTSFTLTLDAEGRANAKFQYPGGQSQAD